MHYICMHICVWKSEASETKGLEQRSRCQLCSKTMVGTLNRNITYLNQLVPVKCTQVSNVYSTRDHICLFRGRLSLFIFPPSSMPPYPQVMSLRLNLSYLWYRDSIRKNLTQFLRGLVLELLKSIFKVAYKWVRILARYLRLKTPWWESIWTLEPQHETINTGCLFLITTEELHVNLSWPWWATWNKIEGVGGFVFALTTIVLSRADRSL